MTREEFGNVLKRIVKYIAGGQDGNVDLRCEDRVPTFWANSSNVDAAIADMIVLAVGVCFGAIHCISWGFPFPTHTELLIWRVSCVSITAVPVCISLGYFLGGWLADMNFGDTVLYFFPISGGILYLQDEGHYWQTRVLLSLKSCEYSDVCSGASRHQPDILLKLLN